MTLATWLALSLGAAVGAPSRFLLDGAVQARTSGIQPRGTLTVNAVGSLILGLLTGLLTTGHVASIVGTLVGTGFCGALTTFSTFAFETVQLLEEGAVVAAGKNVVVTTAVALALAALGYTVVVAW